MRTTIAAITLSLLLSLNAFGEDDLSFAAISQRHPAAKMSDAELAKLQAEGECLAGIKALGSLPMDQFQPNIEWLNIRTQAMLAFARPCEVLAMLEAAHNALATSNAPSHKK
ncbi:MAG TPA: hypothetical protein VE907_07395 [Gammaproteobacteria bacterium]|nr:hypothetical protein [Gammaproteobacteria bacterium]